ncbi:phosphatidylinositol-4-phosphate 5-kinase family protein, putative [Ichthyophthirius multifiliis]|uniref:Phosphatidylinositol-4-phosphate 5-kinase family protein, putative n=1 Tax=Ichthyophthirius multifiliis TaxID=5932 RepID=G0QQS7_ICHMU|nr:phosphatidylinositol-4-phosphate 5-kinase family protein, putative [Ichthyophthirius multifiliis]EGR32428.1 phosphatidylinositol-4-phosphate 5-kinase family protein, putative [Ichthyophthirius multifiliis]|eukprot:XP_004036414.1 phosphatidylinositol-4-phosphate 5-kinase family protein, putative [Ichthyophthirius multifiliis]
MTQSTGFLDRQKFRDCMGILGLDSVQFLSDRLFNVMADPKGQIPFNRFLIYIDTITNGDEQEKVEMSFRLIDDQKKGYFDKENLASMINSIVRSWAALTQTQLSCLIIRNKKIIRKLLFVEFQ